MIKKQRQKRPILAIPRGVIISLRSGKMRAGSTGARSLPISLLQMTLETTKFLSLVGLDLLSLTLSATRHSAPPMVDADLLINYLVQRIFYYALCAAGLERRDKGPDDFFVYDRLNGEPAG